MQTTLLTDKEATLAAILKTLTELQGKLKPTDVAIVHYSSHGEVEDGGLYLLCHDSKRGNLKETALAGQKLRDLLGGYPCPVLLILDACHSGKFPLGRPPTDPLSRMLADDSCGVAVMTAALAHQKAVDTDKGGVFTQALIEGLSGKAKPGGDGKRLYVHQLFTFVFDFVAGKTDQADAAVPALGKRAAHRAEGVSGVDFECPRTGSSSSYPARTSWLEASCPSPSERSQPCVPPCPVCWSV